MDDTRLEGNQAYTGGGLFVNMKEEFSMFMVSNSVFRGNIATNGPGGGICTVGAPMNLVDTDFIQNKSLHHQGGAICLYGTNGVLSMRASNQTCMVVSNTSLLRGGGIVQDENGEGQGATMTLNAAGVGELIFAENNSQQNGGAVYTVGSAVSMTGNILFRDNQCTNNGGGICLEEGSLSVGADSATGAYPEFRGNFSDETGGGLYVMDSSVEIHRAYIQKNYAKDGAGLAISNGSLIIDQSLFSSNWATRAGGGIWAETLTTCQISQVTAPYYSATNSKSLLFTGNLADRGGGLYLSLCSNTLLSHVQVVGNTAVEGAGVYASYQSFATDNSLYYGNRPYIGGGTVGIQLLNSSNSEIYCSTILYNDEMGLLAVNSEVAGANNIFWGHTEESISNRTSTLTMNYSCIQGGFPGIFNIIDNPSLKSDAHLAYDSPCRASGILIPNQDIDGEARTLAMGFDEFVDADNDNFPDYVENNTGVWTNEYQTGTSPNDPDSDGDGQGDWDEWVAGVDPNNPDSLFHITKVWTGPAANEYWVRQVGGTGSTVKIDMATDVTNNVNWQLEATRSPPTARTNDIQFLNVTNKAFFRCRAQLPLVIGP